MTDSVFWPLPEGVGPTTAPQRSANGAAELDGAILRTVTYASLFQFPLSVVELERSLIDVSAGSPLIEERLRRPYLRQRLEVTDGFVHPKGRREWIALRDARGQHTERLLRRHLWLLHLLGRFPFVRSVALSGACAHGNATDDDVDVFLIVRSGRAWAVCLALMLLCKLAGVRRTLCLNYIVDEDALALPENDVFTAFEIVGLKPLAGRDAYTRFVAANSWVADRFPNFFAGYRIRAAAVPEVPALGWRERLLDLGPAPVLEAVSRRLLGARLRRKTYGRPGVVLSPHRLKLHTLDHAPAVLDAFHRALGQTMGCRERRP
jgi:hypothetical protein